MVHVLYGLASSPQGLVQLEGLGLIGTLCVAIVMETSIIHTFWVFMVPHTTLTPVLQRLRGQEPQQATPEIVVGSVATPPPGGSPLAGTTPLNPHVSHAMEYLLLLWPASLCELMAVETDRYACQKGASSWQSVSLPEIWRFLGITVLMGIKRLPRISNYWSRDSFIGVPNLGRYVSQTRFWALRSNLHIVDNDIVPASGGLSRKYSQC